MKFNNPVAVEIAGTSAILPGRKVATKELVAEVYGAEDDERFQQRLQTVRSKTGIESRYFCDPEDCCESLGSEALAQALANSGIAAEELDRVIYVSSGSGEIIFPAAANLICRALNLADSCDCFDLNNACMGFLTALEIATCDIAVGSGPVGIVVAEFPSRITTPAEPRPYLVFGDAVVATVVRKAENGGILSSYLRNDGVTFGNVLLRSAAFTGELQTIQFTDHKSVIENQAFEALHKCIAVALKNAKLTLDEVDWILPHQPNGEMFENIAAEFNLPEEKLIPVAAEIGSTGAAPIPYSFHLLAEAGKIQPGNRILFAGVGGGVSYGAMVYEVPH